MGTLLMLLAPSTFAQSAFIMWQIAFDGGGFAVSTVSDNEAGDLNLAPFDLIVPFTATNNVITITGTIVGEGITNPLGRRLRITDLTASVPPGYFTPLNQPWPTVELLVCYDFTLLGVGPPHVFRSRLQGAFTNIAGGGNNIDFAQIGYNSDCGCGLGRSQLFKIGFEATNADPPVPFDSDITFEGSSCSECPRIGAYMFIKLRNDGDAVNLPGSAESSVEESGSCTAIPALDRIGLVALLIVLLAAGSWIIVRWRRALTPAA